MKYENQYKNKISPRLRQRLEQDASDVVWLELKPAYAPPKGRSENKTTQVPIATNWKEVVENANLWILWTPLINEHRDHQRIQSYWYEYDLDGTVNVQVNEPDTLKHGVETQVELHNIRRTNRAQSTLKRFGGRLDEIQDQYDELRRLAGPPLEVEP